MFRVLNTQTYTLVIIMMIIIQKRGQEETLGAMEMSVALMVVMVSLVCIYPQLIKLYKLNIYSCTY